jgi:hypothetical protein
MRDEIKNEFTAAETEADQPNRVETETDGTESGSGEKGKRGGGSSGGGPRLNAAQLSEVMKNWAAYLDPKDVMRRVAEFFSEMPVKVSAQAQVDWMSNVLNKGFAVIHQFATIGQRAAAHDLRHQRAPLPGATP